MAANHQVIWLTGASSGIGEALVRRLAKDQCRLAISARRKETLDALVEELSDAPATVKAFPADVTDHEQIGVLAASIEEEFGPIDVLIANAGTHLPSDVTNFDVRQYERLMRINFLGVLNCVEMVLPSMIDRKRGVLVPVSSLTGYRGLPTAEAYGASKAALINFFESLRFDLLEHNVDVCIVNPGFVKTPLTDKNDFPMPFRIEAEKAAEIIADGIAKRRMEIHFPWQFSWIMKFMRVLPYPIYHFIVSRTAVRS